MLWRFFIFFFLVSFIIINWSDISWLFNYRFLLRGIGGFFDGEPPQTLEIMKDIQKSANQERGLEALNDKSNAIEIPSLGLKAPLVFSKNSSQNEMQKSLKMGVVHYPESVLPGEKGASIILGHSAPPNWPKINYDWVFNDLYKLKTDDLIYVYFNHHQYVFKIREKFFLLKGEEISTQDLTDNGKSYILLLSCWPPGKDLKRIAVKAELAN